MSNTLIEMTALKVWEKANNEASETLFNLYARWQVEKDFEDIKEYGNVVSNSLDCPVVKCTKRPFGFHVEASDGTLVIKMVSKGDNIVLKGSILRK